MNQIPMQFKQHISTQCTDVLESLHTRGYIDPLIALQTYGIMRLASRILELKKRGYNIHSEMVPFKTQYGRNGAFCRYTLDE